MIGTKYLRIIDPSDIAADVTILLSIRDNIPRKDALAAFMRSDTFRHILEDESMADIDPRKRWNSTAGRFQDVYEPITVSNREFLQMFTAIALKYSEIYDEPLDKVVDSFNANGVYEMLGDGRSEYITKTYPYMAHYVRGFLDCTHNKV